MLVWTAGLSIVSVFAYETPLSHMKEYCKIQCLGPVFHMFMVFSLNLRWKSMKYDG